LSDIAHDDEILELAISRENDANRFYLTMADRVADESLKRLLEGLAAEELQHREMLELELMKSGQVVKPQIELPQEEQISVEAPPDLDINYKDILLMGVKKEDISFKLYVNLAGRVKDPESKKILLELAEFEMKHKIMFEREYEKVLKQS